MTIITPSPHEPVEPTERRKLRSHEREAILDRQAYRCAGRDCSTNLRIWPFEVDHVIPLWMGGADEPSNMEALCLPCHKVKTAADAKARAKAKRLHLKDTGQWPKAKRPIRGRGFQPRYEERNQ